MPFTASEEERDQRMRARSRVSCSDSQPNLDLAAQHRTAHPLGGRHRGKSGAPCQWISALPIFRPLRFMGLYSFFQRTIVMAGPENRFESASSPRRSARLRQVAQ